MINKLLLLSVGKRADFLDIGKNNVKFYSPSLLLLAKKTPEKYLVNPHDGKANDFCRVGYTVTKKISKKAVIRNTIKRRFREAFRKAYEQKAKNHFDYIVIARNKSLEADFEQICKDLEFCFKGVNRLMEEENGKTS